MKLLNYAVALSILTSGTALAGEYEDIRDRAQMLLSFTRTSDTHIFHFSLIEKSKCVFSYEATSYQIQGVVKSYHTSIPFAAHRIKPKPVNDAPSIRLYSSVLKKVGFVYLTTSEINGEKSNVEFTYNKEVLFEVPPGNEDAATKSITDLVTHCKLFIKR